MNPPNNRHVLTISISTAVIFGTMWHRIFSDWGALVSDVGSDGAWIVSIVYYGIYGCFISMGTMLSAINLKKFNKTLNKISIGVSALLSIAILELYLKINMPKEDIFWELVAILVSSGWVINSAIAPDIWMHNTRLDRSR